MMVVKKSKAPPDPKYCMYCKPKTLQGRVQPVELEKNTIFQNIMICPKCKTEYHLNRVETELYISVRKIND